MRRIKNYLPILILLILAVSVWVYFKDDLTFTNLKAHRELLLSWVEGYPILAPLYFIFICMAGAALSIPGALFLTIISGFLFPQPLSMIYVLIGGTSGAAILFLAARRAFRDLLKRFANPYFHKMEEGFRKNSANYLLFLRFIPIFPFWIVNLVPAFFNVRLWTFVWTTFIGTIPGSFIYTSIGKELGAAFDMSEEFSIHAFFNWKLKLLLIALAVLSILPVLIKKR